MFDKFKQFLNIFRNTNFQLVIGLFAVLLITSVLGVFSAHAVSEDRLAYINGVDKPIFPCDVYRKPNGELFDIIQSSKPQVFDNFNTNSDVFERSMDTTINITWILCVRNDQVIAMPAIPHSDKS